MQRFWNVGREHNLHGRLLKKEYKTENAKSISKLPKNEKNRILAELKTKFPVRQLQRITGISRGVITRIK